MQVNKTMNMHLNFLPLMILPRLLMNQYLRHYQHNQICSPQPEQLFFSYLWNYLFIRLVYFISRDCSSPLWHCTNGRPPRSSAWSMTLPRGSSLSPGWLFSPRSFGFPSWWSCSSSPRKATLSRWAVPVVSALVGSQWWFIALKQPVEFRSRWISWGK